MRAVTLGDGERLGRFFAAISGEEAVTRHFHPHAFTRDEAWRICSRPAASRDIYILAVDADEVVGYAMLRGWDEGYEVPAFGLCVLPSHQGAGLGSRLLDYALACACARGAPRVMLKVNVDNRVARQLYESRGFDFAKFDDDQLVGYKNLEVGPQQRA